MLRLPNAGFFILLITIPACRAPIPAPIANGYEERVWLVLEPRTASHPTQVERFTLEPGGVAWPQQSFSAIQVCDTRGHRMRTVDIGLAQYDWVGHPWLLLLPSEAYVVREELKADWYDTRSELAEKWERYSVSEWHRLRAKSETTERKAALKGGER